MTVILNQPDAEYHASPAIGSTSAKLWLESPQLFRDDQTGVRKRKDSKVFQFGRAAHAKFTDYGLFRRMVKTGPLNPKTNKPYGPDTNAFAEWSAENPGAIVLSESEFADLDMMDKRMPKEVVGMLRNGGTVESSFYVTIAGVEVKCRPDLIGADVIYDIKTIGNIADAEKHISKYKYWFSHAWYRMIVKRELGQSVPFRFVFAEKNPPYRWRVIDIDADWIGYADATVERVITEIAFAQDTGDWSDKGEICVMASRPAWESDDEETEDGE